MRILHVVTAIFRPGGAENHLLTLVREQAARGHEVDLAWLKGDGTLAGRFRDAGCREVFKTPFDRPRHALSAVAALRRRIAEQRYDVVHTHLLKANALGGIAARLSPRRPATIATKHNDEHVLRHSAIGRLHGMLSRLTDDHVICISDHVRAFMAHCGHVPPARTSRIYYGFDPALYARNRPADVRAEFGLPGDSFLFGIVGRLTEQKNHLFLLPVFADLARAHPEARLLIVGGDGYTPDYRLRVERTIRTLGLGDRAIMTGWRPDAYALMGGLDCMVLPSAWEGLGLVFIEAIAQGVPVVATRASAVPEAVRDGIDGILVAPGDAQGLYRAMERMIVERDRIRCRTRREGPPHIARTFSVARMVDETLAVYRRALDRRGRQRDGG